MSDIIYLWQPTFMYESQYGVKDVNYNQNNINSILNIHHEFSDSNNFNVGEFDVKHVCNLDQTSNQSCSYQYYIRFVQEDLDNEW